MPNMYNLQISDDFIDIYSRYLWIGSPVKAAIWMIWNEESWPTCIKDVEYKLYNNWLVDDIFWEYDIENGISYRHDLTIDEVTWSSNTPLECRTIHDYYFTKEIEYVFKLNSPNKWRAFLEDIQVWSVYFQYLQFMKLIQKKYKSDIGIFQHTFLWEFYFLPSITSTAFEEIYQTPRKEFYKKNESILYERCIELRNILDFNIDLERKKVFFWGDWEDKISILTKVFWGFQQFTNKRIALLVDNKSKRTHSPIYFCNYEWHKLYICPFIKYISDINELAMIVIEFEA